MLYRWLRWLDRTDVGVNIYIFGRSFCNCLHLYNPPSDSQRSLKLRELTVS